MTLKDALSARGLTYNTIFKNRAEDIDFADTIEICEALGYIVNHVSRFDFEIPDDHPMASGYEIANGLTSGGYEMKYANQYRIYFNTTRNMPIKLRQRLQNDNHKRITGSKFIEACHYLGFVHGSAQNRTMISNNIRHYFSHAAEQAAFSRGLSL